MMSVRRADTSSSEQPGVQRATFILRLQREPHGEARATWRGTLEHVQSGERRAVPDAASAAALVINWLHAIEEAPNAQSG